MGELLRLPRAARRLDLLHGGRELRAARRRTAARADRARRAVAAAARRGPDRDAARHQRARHRRRPTRAAGHHRLARVRRRPRRRARDHGTSTSSPTASRRPRADPPPPADLGQGERPVVLSVASDLPHKNLAALIDGLAALDERPAARVRRPRHGHRRAGARAARRRAASRCGCSAASTPTGSRRSTPPPRSWPPRRASRASASRCSRRWRAACRWRAPSCRCCARWPVTRRSTSTPRIRRRSPARYERRSLRGSGSGLPAASARREFSWAAAARATAEVYERALTLR